VEPIFLLSQQKLQNWLPTNLRKSVDSTTWFLLWRLGGMIWRKFPQQQFEDNMSTYAKDRYWVCLLTIELAFDWLAPQYGAYNRVSPWSKPDMFSQNLSYYIFVSWFHNQHQASITEQLNSVRKFCSCKSWWGVFSLTNNFNFDILKVCWNFPKI